MSSTNGSLIGYFREPHSTECSKMCGIPVLFSGGVRNVTPKHLFSSSFESDMTSAPVLRCLNRNAFASYSATYSSRTSSKPWRSAPDGGARSAGAISDATARLCSARIVGVAPTPTPLRRDAAAATPRDANERCAAAGARRATAAGVMHARDDAIARWRTDGRDDGSTTSNVGSTTRSTRARSRDSAWARNDEDARPRWDATAR
mmetsp:Transcript_5534/g.20012  ORF Transcript_5534/g.20012 Transcript_5534/m.20012 type:complete len:204 (+) Transcript_5534:2845-3456(+)